MRSCFFVLLALLISGCHADWNRGECLINLSFSENWDAGVEAFATKGSGISLPDTNDFILVVREEVSGEDLYNGKYGERPSEIKLVEGDYLFGVYSCEFTTPAFDLPQVGDEQSLTVSGSSVDVSFECNQLNSGLRLTFDEKFKSRFAGSSIILKQDEMELEYPFTEGRIAYFAAGKVKIILSYNGSERQLLARTLNPNEVLTINFSVDLSDATGADFNIAIDTGRVWISEEYVYGRVPDGSSQSKAIDVKNISDMVGSEDVWVKGYIVGGDLSSSEATYTPPFTSKTNLMIGPKSSSASREGCASVELKSSTVRNGLNLVDHPEHLGKMVYLKGDIVAAYFGLVGIKNVSDYSFE